MSLLALLAVFTAEAGDGSGPAFAMVYATFLVLVTWLFDTVRRQERHERPEFVAETRRYVVCMAVAVVVILVSALLPAEPRLLVIVLGEVVFGVVDGLSSAGHNVKTITTGMLALWIGLSLWWIYFDLVGRRLPRNNGRAIANSLLSHLPSRCPRQRPVRLQPSSPAGLDQRPGSWRCCSWRSSPCSGCSRSAASSAPSRGPNRPAPTEITGPAAPSSQRPDRACLLTDGSVMGVGGR